MRDDSLADSVAYQSQSVSELESNLQKQLGVQKDLSPWIQSLGEGSVELFTALGSKAKAARKAVWEAARDSEALEDRLAAVEMLAFVAGEGAAVDMQELVSDLGKERSVLRKKLPAKARATCNGVPSMTVNPFAPRSKSLEEKELFAWKDGFR